MLKVIGTNTEHVSLFKTIQLIRTPMSAIVIEVNIFLGTYRIWKIQEMAEHVYGE